MKEFAIEMRIRNFGDVGGFSRKVERPIQRAHAHALIRTMNDFA